MQYKITNNISVAPPIPTLEARLVLKTNRLVVEMRRPGEEWYAIVLFNDEGHLARVGAVSDAIGLPLNAKGQILISPEE